MRIALVAPLAEAVPPKLYGGTERVVSWLAEELVKQGHRVALFASAESETTAELVVCAPQSLRLAGVRDHLGSTLAMLREVRRRADDFDIIHFHLDLLPQALFHDLAHKCLVTLLDASISPMRCLSIRPIPKCRWSRFQTRSAVQCRRMPMARDNPARPSAARLSVQPEWRQLFGFPRTYLARKAPGPVNRNRQAGRYPLEDRGKGGRHLFGIFQDQH